MQGKSTLEITVHLEDIWQYRRLSVLAFLLFISMVFLKYLSHLCLRSRLHFRVAHPWQIRKLNEQQESGNLCSRKGVLQIQRAPLSTICRARGLADTEI